MITKQENPSTFALIITSLMIIFSCATINFINSGLKIYAIICVFITCIFAAAAYILAIFSQTKLEESP